MEERHEDVTLLPLQIGGGGGMSQRMGVIL